MCLTLGSLLYTKRGRLHFSHFGIILGEIRRDMQGFEEGESSSIGGHFEMEARAAAACGVLPAEIFMRFVLFASPRIQTHDQYFI